METRQPGTLLGTTLSSGLLARLVCILTPRRMAKGLQEATGYRPRLRRGRPGNAGTTGRKEAPRWTLRAGNLRKGDLAATQGSPGPEGPDGNAQLLEEKSKTRGRVGPRTSSHSFGNVLEDDFRRRVPRPSIFRSKQKQTKAVKSKQSAKNKVRNTKEPALSPILRSSAHAEVGVKSGSSAHTNLDHLSTQRFWGGRVGWGWVGAGGLYWGGGGGYIQTCVVGVGSGGMGWVGGVGWGWGGWVYSNVCRWGGVGWGGVGCIQTCVVGLGWGGAGWATKSPNSVEE